MIRLGALVLGTLAGLFLLLGVLGDKDLRAERRPMPQVQPAAEEAEAPEAAPDQIVQPSPPAVVQAAAQTPAQVQRFPGPALRPSPEHADADRADAPASNGPVLYVTGNRVNVRAGPSTGDGVVTALDRGAAVQPLGPTDGEWVNIRVANGNAGYVAGRFLSATAP
ncbi:SH3 domain-containing protein [Paracoccus subflavus]|uniref:SH3 domain-containing protein n=1 Tax=Paracoccus subflavus TaxID=2528244 RepID=A0A4Q9G562_9RHOB|nr:SH3 domain-containing protein [Paracoccus subflavus]TBN39374.1 SH3 domain-containing protein [Paracoccus subflavus]